MWVQTGAYHLEGLYWLIALVVVFIFALIALSVAVRALTRAKNTSRAGIATSREAVGQPGAPATAEDRKPPESFRMLDERYAKGEIGREEYMQRQTDIQAKV